MKTLHAVAVVKKIRPILNVLQIYSKKDRKDLQITKDEVIVEIEIKQIV